MSADTERTLRTGLVWNLVPVVVLGVVGLGMNFAIGRWWGTPVLGVFSQVTTAYFVLASIGAIGINLSVLRAIAQHPADRPLTPNDLWATVYRHLGIDYTQSFPDHSGRPMPILHFGEPIAELLRA